MPRFDGSTQIVLQRSDGPGRTICVCFDTVPTPDPVLIVILSEGGQRAEADASRVAVAAEAALAEISRSGRSFPGTCGPGPGPGPTGCFAHGEPRCRRVLVLVSDATRPFLDQTGAIQFWAREQAKGNSRFIVLPAFARSQQAKVAGVLPSCLSAVNAFFWSNEATEIVPVILSAAGIAPEDYRIFISYRRQDSQPLADQLFDLLSRRNFDVFLDQYRISPGVNFQEYLREQLAHKSMVVVLESATAQSSLWVQEEVTFAMTHRLGILGIQLPGGKAFPVIQPARRVQLPNGALDASGELLDPWPDRVCNRIQITHAIALARRRAQMLRAMEYALLLRGVRARCRTDGIVEGRSPAGNDFALWLTPRPAELRDFQSVDSRITSRQNLRSAIVAPATRLPGRRQSEMTWLENKSGIPLYDEGEIGSLATAISKGVL